MVHVNMHCNGRVNHTEHGQTCSEMVTKKHAELMAVGDAGWVGFQSDLTEAG